MDRCLASCSGDRTVKVWSITDFSCLRTFQGHTASVLSVGFVSAGAQLVSGGADGLVKVWTVRSDECEATLDAHTDKVWALTTARAPPRRRTRRKRPRTRPDDGEHGDEEAEEDEEGEERSAASDGPNSGLVVVSGGADSVINVWKDVTAREEVGFVLVFLVRCAFVRRRKSFSFWWCARGCLSLPPCDRTAPPPQKKKMTPFSTLSVRKFVLHT